MVGYGVARCRLRVVFVADVEEDGKLNMSSWAYSCRLIPMNCGHVD